MSTTVVRHAASTDEAHGGNPAGVVLGTDAPLARSPYVAQSPDPTHDRSTT